MPESSELPDTVQLNSNTNEGSIVSSTEPTEQPDSSENAETTETPTSRYFCYPNRNLTLWVKPKSEISIILNQLVIQ